MCRLAPENLWITGVRHGASQVGWRRGCLERILRSSQGRRSRPFAPPAPRAPPAQPPSRRSSSSRATTTPLAETSNRLSAILCHYSPHISPKARLSRTCCPRPTPALQWAKASRTRVRKERTSRTPLFATGCRPTAGTSGRPTCKNPLAKGRRVCVIAALWWVAVVAGLLVKPSVVIYTAIIYVAMIAYLTLYSRPTTSSPR